jgi:hypothetical protein
MTEFTLDWATPVPWTITFNYLLYFQAICYLFGRLYFEKQLSMVNLVPVQCQPSSQLPN